MSSEMCSGNKKHMALTFSVCIVILFLLAAAMYVVIQDKAEQRSDVCYLTNDNVLCYTLHSAYSKSLSDCTDGYDRSNPTYKQVSCAAYAKN